jgi:hypothetical protein
LTKDFASLAQHMFVCNFPNLYYKHLHNQGTDFKEETFQAPRVVSRLPQSDDSSGTSGTLDSSRSTFFTSTASFYNNIQLDLSDCDHYPPVVEATTEPSVTSGISSTSISPPAAPARGGSYFSRLGRDSIHENRYPN